MEYIFYLFVLFNDTVNSTDSIASDEGMINE
jgi:hypothetical protein